MLFGVTIGDPSGVGPEILLKAWNRGELNHPIVAFGDLEVLEFYNRALGLGVVLRRILRPDKHSPGALNVVDVGRIKAQNLEVGRVSELSGSAARDYVVAATNAAILGDIAAVVTLPMNKEATRLSDPRFVGHTELIAELCGVKDVTIMLASAQLIVTHVSTHVSLETAIARVKQDRIRTIIQLTVDAVRRLREHPRIAVAGLNPHAGENGLFGQQEIEEIVPAVRWAQARGMPVEGPFPPDTVFYMAVRKKMFDAVICMYHDQGHIPLKLIDFEGGVNISLGLPIIRTSVDHGTAFDIAGKGVASTLSLVRALDFAAGLAASTP